MNDENKAVSESEMMNEQISAYKIAIKAAIEHIAASVDDADDPIVALMSVAVTATGEYVIFQHGAIEHFTAPEAVALLQAEVIRNCIARRGKRSPLETTSTGNEFTGGNAAYRAFVAGGAE